MWISVDLTLRSSTLRTNSTMKNISSTSLWNETIALAHINLPVSGREIECWMESNHIQVYMCIVRPESRKQQQQQTCIWWWLCVKNDHCRSFATRIFLRVGLLWFYFALILSITSAPHNFIALPFFLLSVHHYYCSVTTNSEDDYIMNNTVELMTTYLHTNTTFALNGISHQEKMQ